MRIEQLRYFVEAAKCHSIAIAAEKLFVTQPTVSIAIKNLERELDCVLLERSKNGVQLTKIGREVLQKCESILQSENDIHLLVEQDSSRQKSKLQGTLRIVSIPMITHSFLHNAIFDFLNRYDEVQVVMKEANVQYITSMVLHGEMDLGFTLLDEPDGLLLKNNQALYAKKLFSEKTYIVAHKKFELSGNQSIRSDELSGLPMVSFTTLPITYYNHLADKLEHAPKIILQTYSLELIKRFIYSGKAISILSSSVVSKLENVEELDIIPISDLESGKLYYFYRQDNACTDIITAFEAEVLRHC